MRHGLFGTNQARETTRFHAKLDKWILAYMAAASAAGAGILSLASPAEAEIIFTLADIPITPNRGVVPLDLNNDGAADFQFYAFYTTGGLRPDLGTHASGLYVGPAQAGNAIWAVSSTKHGPLAKAVPVGHKVGKARPFQAKSLTMAFSGGNYTGGGTAFGQWLGVKKAFLGLKFVIQGKHHFGWARITVDTSSGRFDATVTGYAYETVPGKAIVTGQKVGAADAGRGGSRSSRKSATLGQLALGAVRQ